MSQAEVFTLVILSVLLLAGLYFFFRSILRILPRVVWIDVTPTSQIRSLAMGLVEVTGNVKIANPITSPATGMPCCLTRYKVQELRVVYTKQGRTTSWQTINTGFFYTPFFLQDKDGDQILVDPVGAEIVVPWETYYPNTGFPDGETGTIRYLEQAIYSNSLLFVLGEAKKKSRYADYNGEVDARLAVLRGDPEKMASLDTNKDGQVDAVEWENAVRKAEEEVTEEMAAAAKDELDTVVLGKPSVKRPFILSTRSEKEILTGLRWKGYSMLVLGLTLVFFNLAGILGFFTGQPPFGKNYYKVIKSIVENKGY